MTLIIDLAELQYLVGYMLGRDKHRDTLNGHPDELLGNQMAPAEIEVLNGHKKASIKIHIRNTP